MSNLIDEIRAARLPALRAWARGLDHGPGGRAGAATQVQGREVRNRS